MIKILIETRSVMPILFRSQTVILTNKSLLNVLQVGYLKMLNVNYDM